jgi:hypothetical protein
MSASASPHAALHSGLARSAAAGAEARGSDRIRDSREATFDKAAPETIEPHWKASIESATD